MPNSQPSANKSKLAASPATSKDDNPIQATDRLIAFRHFLNKYRRPIGSYLGFLLLIVGLAAATILMQQPQDLRQQAKQPPAPVTWQEVDLSPNDATTKTAANLNTKLNPTVISVPAAKSTSLPVTGEWLGQTVKVVPNDRFPDAFYSYHGVMAVEEMSDQNLYLGTYDYFGIKQPTDEDWTNITFYDPGLPFNSTITFFTETLDTPYEVYFGDDRTSGGKIIRRLADGSLELIADPTELSGYLRNVYITPYKDDASSHGMIGHRFQGEWSSEVYYLEQGSLRKWVLPYRTCNQSIVGDHIYAMATDPKTNRTFAIVYDGANCDGHTYLYELKFSIDPEIPLEIIVLGKITGPVDEMRKGFISQRLDDPSQQIFYAGSSARNNDEYLVIPYFYTDGRDMTVELRNLDDVNFPSIYDMHVMLKPDGLTDQLWFVATEVLGVYRGINFDTTEPDIIDKTDNNAPFLANPYLNSVTSGLNNITYIGHDYLGSQFNQALVTIFEPPLPPSNTPPEIITTALPVGYVGQPYEAVIRGGDQDLGDILEMSILPHRSLADTTEGWNSTCTTGVKNGYEQIRCRLRGLPQQPRETNIQIDLTDQQATTSAIVHLSILPAP